MSLSSCPGYISDKSLLFIWKYYREIPLESLGKNNYSIYGKKEQISDYSIQCTFMLISEMATLWFLWSAALLVGLLNSLDVYFVSAINTVFKFIGIKFEYI